GPFGATRQHCLVAAASAGRHRHCLGAPPSSSLTGSASCHLHTPERVTSALPGMSDGCHLERRILSAMRVLVVEDHATLAGRIAQGLRQAGMAVDRARHRASRGSRQLSLTRKEFGVLETLLAADGALVSAEDLLEHVWDTNADPFSNIVSVTMTRLRRKLGDPPLIETVVGKGYR